MPNAIRPINKESVSKAVNIAKNHSDWFEKGKIKFVFKNSNEQTEEIRFGFDKNKLIITGHDADKNGAFNTLYLFQDGVVSQKCATEKKGHPLTSSNWASSIIEIVLEKIEQQEQSSKYPCNDKVCLANLKDGLCPNGLDAGFHTDLLYQPLAGQISPVHDNQ